LITQAEFNNAIVSNGYAQPSTNQYTNLVDQAGTKGNIKSKIQLAIFLAQIMWETGGLREMREQYCYPVLNKGCDYSTPGVGYSGQNYFGRGYIQLVSFFKTIYYL